MFTKIFTISALAMVAVASPGSKKLTTDVQAEQCGNGNKISCCNSASVNGGGLLNNLISGLNCVDVPVLAVPVLNQCSGSNVAACCPAGSDNNNLINIQCVPITL